MSIDAMKQMNQYFKPSRSVAYLNERLVLKLQEGVIPIEKFVEDVHNLLHVADKSQPLTAELKQALSEFESKWGIGK